MKLDDFVKRTEELILLADEALQTEGRTKWGGTHVDAGAFSAFRSSSLSFLKNLYGVNHPYYTDFDSKTEAAVGDAVLAGRAIVAAVAAELKGGWLATARGLISAEIFADFLEMGTYLLSEGYKDPAAVIIGSVLEEHLRQLCLKEGIATTTLKARNTVAKKADTMNGELAGAGIYNKLDQKNVTAWLDLRNKAAHGQYAEYTKAQVDHMAQAVTEFMARNPV